MLHHHFWLFLTVTHSAVLIKIIICEDHDVVVEGIRLMLSDQSEFLLCGHAYNLTQLLTLIEQQKPQLLLLDLNLKKQDGFSILETLTQKYPKLKVLIFTMYEESYLIEKAIKLKANGYILKNASNVEFREALRQVTQSPGFYLASQLKKQQQTNEAYRDQFVEKMHLTLREIEIIKLIVAGKSAKEIAEVLFLSMHTVDTHRRNIMIKLKIKNVADLVRFAFENHLN